MPKLLTEYEKHEAEKRALSLEYARRSAALSEIIRPLRTARYEADFDWTYARNALAGFEVDYGGMELNPDFQRGHVWTPEQQRHYLENSLRGVVSSSGFLIQFNCPNWDIDSYKGDLPSGFQCIDGLQRLTAVFGFLAGNVRPFSLTPDDLVRSSFMIKSSYRFRFAVHNFTRRADLLQHYLDLNAGGTPHTQEEIERVRKMRDAALQVVVI